MGAIIYKCPNCGGELVFDPDGQKFSCPYCASSFSQQELDAITPDEGETTTWQADEDENASSAAFSAEKEKNTEGAVVYNCPSCGAQIMTDETTAATFCYYCHNPVVLQGRLSGDFLPDSVIPFKISRDNAVRSFMEYVRKKKFVPKAFFDEQQIEKMTGVYYPYWIYDCQLDADISAKATKIRVWRAGDTEFTETSVFEAIRHGDVSLNEISRNALSKTDRQLVENVQPYKIEDAAEFSMGYLSGFQAEKRDLEKNSFEQDLQKEAEKYAKNLLSDTIQGYNTVTVQHESYRKVSDKWRYMLLPVWVLTYKGRGDKTYYYAMNGQTGKIFGELPVDHKKLGLLSAVIFGAATILGVIGGFML